MTEKAFEQMMSGLKQAKDEYGRTVFPDCRSKYYAVRDAIELLKKQEDLKQKMWNALYAEEDKLEKKFVGTEELHDRWIYVYRPWLQRGFEIAIKVIAEQDGM